MIVVAKNDAAHRKLAAQFSRRQVKKTYIALVHGWPRMTKGTIRAAIGRDPVRRARMTTRQGSRSKPGRDAITHWQVTRQIEGAYGKFSLLEVKIETGRTHQIRVHLSSIGHPVVGDALYGAPRPKSYGGTAPEVASLERNFLHASAIQFQHPISNRPLSFQQPLPAELSNFLRKIGD